jgi:hypothetical protein
MLIFAYGSNMLVARMRERVPSAVPVANGHLSGYQLRWHKHGMDGSAKCDASWTGLATDRILGVAYRIDPAEKSHLDAAEGLHRGYEQRQVQVGTTRGILLAQMYYATAIAPRLRPFDWYRALVRSGAVEHGLPQAYIRQHIESIAVVSDPDQHRARHHFAMARASPRQQ